MIPSANPAVSAYILKLEHELQSAAKQMQRLVVRLRQRTNQWVSMEMERDELAERNWELEQRNKRLEAEVKRLEAANRYLRTVNESLRWG